MAMRQIRLSPEADPILDSVAESFGGVANLESFLDEMEGAHAAELTRQRDRSTREFQQGLTISWSEIRHDTGL